MDNHEFLADGFGAHRPHLRDVAYRMLGSSTEADDAVQEAWLRLNRTDTTHVEDLGGWLTTVVARVCLELLRRRGTGRESALGDEAPDDEVLIADSIGIAFLAVLESLEPDERLAFVLHDMFGVAFDEIATHVKQSPATTEQLVNRARHQMRTTGLSPDQDLSLQRRTIELFQAASRNGDLAALRALLDPDVVLLSERGLVAGAGWTEVHGADAVVGQALAFRRLSAFSRLVVVNGTAALLTSVDGEPMAVMNFTIVGSKIAEIEILTDPDQVLRLDIATPGDH